ncbi:hypothetical protein [Providencia sneebia]|uniref:Uncharacterized protein n=1 Tax=Providencia sneebia DSM 19967 TaxID=1141660 RepID=K8W4M7_9GAMM|nr:hypothetical protein OO7_10904 [Providencia sneebia DSM 19967]EKT55543.1 hypothetical protein OO7_11184 [Providencia sneebia DSM 19967]
MMHSESKDVYGTDVFGLIATFHQVRRWWVIRKLRKDWNDSRYCLVMCRKFSLVRYEGNFSVQERYAVIRIYAEYHQQRGAI